MDLRDDPFFRQLLRSGAWVTAAAFESVRDEDDDLAPLEGGVEILRRLEKGVGDGGLSLGFDSGDEGLYLCAVERTDGDLELRVFAVVRPVAVDPKPHGEPLSGCKVIDYPAEGHPGRLDAGGTSKLRPHASRGIEDELDMARDGFFSPCERTQGKKKNRKNKDPGQKSVKSVNPHHDQPPLIE